MKKNKLSNTNHVAEKGHKIEYGPKIMSDNKSLLQYIDLQIQETQQKSTQGTQGMQGTQGTQGTLQELVQYRNQLDEEIKEKDRIAEEKETKRAIGSWDKARHPGYFDKKTKILPWPTVFRAMKVKYPKAQAKELDENEKNQFLGNVLYTETQEEAPYELREKCNAFLAKNRNEKLYRL